MALSTPLGTLATVPVANEHLQAGIGPYNYQYVAAGSTDQLLGAAGAVGDYFYMIQLIPAVVSGLGVVTIKDAPGGTSRTIFGGGTVPSLIPFPFLVSGKSLAGGWYITTGANIAAWCVGQFTQG